MSSLASALIWHTGRLLSFRPCIQQLPSGRPEALTLIALSTLLVAFSLGPLDALLHVAILSGVVLHLQQNRLAFALALISFAVHLLSLGVKLAPVGDQLMLFRVYEVALWIFTVHRWRVGS